MLSRKIWAALLRLAFHLFYNPFAFTYDPISALVSRGHWREWTRAAIPHVVGVRVLEIPCGTGNLLLDLSAARYRPIGVDLSSAMIRISHRKLRRARAAVHLTRARAQSLPFPSAAFDSVVMTFPPGFIFDRQVLAELYRIVAPRGRLIWVDAGRLLPRDAWSRFLNWALDVTSGEGSFEQVASGALQAAGFAPSVVTVRDEKSSVQVVIGTKMLPN